MSRKTFRLLMLAFVMMLLPLTACTQEVAEPEEEKPDLEAEDTVLLRKVNAVETKYGKTPSVEEAIEAIKKLEDLKRKAGSHLFKARKAAIILGVKYDKILTKELKAKMQEIIDAAEKAFRAEDIDAAVMEFDKLDEKLLEVGSAARGFLEQKNFFVSIKKARDAYPNIMSEADKLEMENKFIEAYDVITHFYNMSTIQGGCLLSNPMQDHIKNRMDRLEGEIVKIFNAMSPAKLKEEFGGWFQRHSVDIRTVANYFEDFKRIAAKVGIDVGE